MREGLYRASFQTPLGVGAGVVHLQGGRLWGGDAGLYYTGRYLVSGSDLTADVATDRHTEYPGILSVFGMDRVHIHLKGSWNGDVAQLIGSAQEAPGVPFQVILTRISD